MRFTDFLRTTVLASAAAASLLAAVTIIRVATLDENGVVAIISAGWWVATAAIGLWSGRRPETSRAIGTLLADARSGRSLPEINPARTLVNRLWPLLAMCLIAAGIGIALPQVSAIAAGFAILAALSWRRQASAVTAIEERDGARFYIEHTSPLRPIKLLRTPGFRSAAAEPASAGTPAPSGRPGT